VGPPPLHRQPRLVLAVLAGGLVGTPARYGLSVLLPTPERGWPAGTFVANLLGAFLLGVLLEALARQGSDTGRRRLLRLGLGTGFLGAFTTYSALAVEVDLLVRAGRPGLGAAYALVSVLAGLLLSLAGIAAAAAWRRTPA
jgi:CrcB protein